MPVMIKCQLQGCPKWFPVKPSKQFITKYCCKEHQSLSQVKVRLVKICENELCPLPNREFEVFDNVYREGARCCSQACFHAINIGEKNHKYKHGAEREEMIKARKVYKVKYYDEHRKTIYQSAFLGKAKRRELIGDSKHTWDEWIDLLRRYDNCCAYCNVRMTKNFGVNQRTRDHVIPLSRGGSDEIINIVPACRSCNSQKGTKTYEEWKGVNFKPREFDPNWKFEGIVPNRDHKIPECSVPLCTKKASGIFSKYCVMHRDRLKKNGDVGVFYSKRDIHLFAEMPKCSVEDCNEDTMTYSNKLCHMHDARVRRNRETGSAAKMKNPKGTKKPECSIEGCVEELRAKNLCRKHYVEFLNNREGHECSMESCKSAIFAKSYCQLHYGQQRTIGGVGSGINCSVVGCKKISMAKSFCGMHHRRWLKTGSVGSVNGKRD